MDAPSPPGLQDPHEVTEESGPAEPLANGLPLEDALTLYGLPGTSGKPPPAGPPFQGRASSSASAAVALEAAGDCLGQSARSDSTRELEIASMAARAQATVGGDMSETKRCTRIINNYSNQAAWQEAVMMLLRMWDDPDIHHPNAYHYCATIKACEKERQWQEAMLLLEHMRRGIVRPDVITYEAVLKATTWTLALELLGEMRRESFEPGIVACTTIMKKASLHDCPWSLTLSMLHELRQRAVQPDSAAYDTAIRACTRGHQWQMALSLLRLMQQEGVQPQLKCWTTISDTCGRVSLWEIAVDLLEQMRASRVSPDRVSYGVVIDSCQQAGQLQLAIELYQEMQRAGVPQMQ